MKTIEFTNIVDYKNFLGGNLTQIAEDMEYNIFMHCVTGNTNYFPNKYATVDEEIKKKVEGIMRHGLNLDGAQDYGNYGSINGTAKFFGNSKEVNPLEIVNYDYFSYMNTVNSIIIAIPKYININGEQVEFSSYKGSMKHAAQHIKDCLFDLIKGCYLPVEFIWAHQIIDNKNGSAVINLNERHLSLLSDADKFALLDKLSKKSEGVLDYCRNKYGINSFEEIFKCMTDEHMTAIDDYLNEI